MNQEIRNLEPKTVWNYFADLNAIPRASKKEERIIAFMEKFAKEINLAYKVDKVGNVLISKPATAGMENRKTIILQGHLDMVHQKNADTNFDFDTQGIEMFIEEDFVKAKGTTLGADNGLGVASIMAVLASKDIAHPALEALFTIDEETGMTGALSLQPGWMKGEILLNLDTEDDDELTIGCAGGIDVTADAKYNEVPATNDSSLVIKIKGLSGGHSGVDIHKDRANANKLLTELLILLNDKFSLEVVALDGGGLRNAIPREAMAQIVFKHSDNESLTDLIKETKLSWQTKYAAGDPSLTLAVEEVATPARVAAKEFIKELLKSLNCCPNGVYRMSDSIDGLVQTSNNLARIRLQNGAFLAQCLTRSSVEEEKGELAEKITACFTNINAKVSTSGNYPGWEPKPNSEIVALTARLYEECFGEKANVNAIHAGLECGIIGSHYPNLQMISFGPNIFGAHSPDERAQISSFEKFWKYFKLVLKNIPEKNN